MGIIVDIGAANADGADSDQHVGRRQIPPDRDVAQRQLPLLFKYKRLCHYLISVLWVALPPQAKYRA